MTSPLQIKQYPSFQGRLWRLFFILPLNLLPPLPYPFSFGHFCFPFPHSLPGLPLNCCSILFSLWWKKKREKRRKTTIASSCFQLNTGAALIPLLYHPSSDSPPFIPLSLLWRERENWVWFFSQLYPVVQCALLSRGKSASLPLCIKPLNEERPMTKQGATHQQKDPLQTQNKMFCDCKVTH